jgi:putative ATP-dependent endonuclease of OLD family
VAALDAIVAGSGGLIEYDRAAELLTVHGKIEERPYRDLLTCYGTHADKAVIHGVLRGLRDRSLLFIGDDELRALETFARRIRGEIFFARRWFIVEGQAEYLLVHAMARELGYDLDEYGVAVIDAMNNGHPATFAALARALAIPWLAVFDGDAAGHQYCQNIVARDFAQAFVTDRCKTLAAGDIEAQLIADGLEADLKTALTRIGVAGAATADLAALLGYLRDHKTAYAAELAAMMRGNAALAGRMPQAFRDAIAVLRGLP